MAALTYSLPPEWPGCQGRRSRRRRRALPLDRLARRWPRLLFRAAVRRIVLARGGTSCQEGAPGRPAQDAARHLGAHCQARPRAGAAPPGPQARRATGAGAGRRPGPTASTRGAGNGATRPPPGHHRPGNNPCFVGVAQVGARQLNKTPGFAGGRGTKLPGHRRAGTRAPPGSKRQATRAPPGAGAEPGP